jgi:effector-binding domain-containing protein
MLIEISESQYRLIREALENYYNICGDDRENIFTMADIDDLEEYLIERHMEQL